MNFDKAIVEVYYSLLAIASRYYYHDDRAHDLAADTVVRALEARDRYDESRPLLAWCRVIMRNLWANTEQKLSVTHTQPLGDWDEPGGEEADQRVMVGDVLSAIDRCRDSVAVETLMDVAKGYTLQEVATSRDVPLGTVKRRVHDGRRMLAKFVHVN